MSAFGLIETVDAEALAGGVVASAFGDVQHARRLISNENGHHSHTDVLQQLSVTGPDG